jgi:hypothetical protein
MQKIAQNNNEITMKGKYSFLVCLLLLFSAISSFYHFGHNDYVTAASPKVSLTAPDPVSQPAIESGNAVKIQARFQNESRVSNVDFNNGEPPLSIASFSPELNIGVFSLKQRIPPADTSFYLSRITFNTNIRAPPFSLS